VEPLRRERDHLAGTWYELGTAAESFFVGLKRIQLDPGKWSRSDKINFRGIGFITRLERVDYWDGEPVSEPD
jgi:hypothetical protein